MVAPLGHVGMALLWLSVGRVAYDRRAATGFVALGVPFSLVPDVDLFLPRFFPTVHHHGVTHTILFVTVVAVVAGIPLGRWVVPRFGATPEIGNGYVYAVGAAWVAMLSHLFADTLSAPDIAPPLELLWPVADYVVGFDIVYYDSRPVNWGLFLCGLGATVLLWWWEAETGSPTEA